MPFFNIYIVLRVKLSSEEHSIWSDIYLHAVNEIIMSFSNECISNLKTFSDHLDSFGIKYTSEQKVKRDLAIFASKLFCVQEEIFKDTER